MNAPWKYEVGHGRLTLDFWVGMIGISGASFT